MKKLLIFLMLFSLYACNSPVTYEEYITLVNDPDNGLIQIKEVSGIKYSVSYRPTSVLLINFAEKEKDTLKKAFEKNLYFVLNLSSSQGDPLYKGDPSLFSSNLQKMAFEMNKLISIKTNTGESLEVTDFQMPNFFGFNKSCEIIFACKKPVADVDEIEIFIDDPGFGAGRQNFLFAKSNLDKVSKLELIKS